MDGITFHLKHSVPLDLKTWSDPYYFKSAARKLIENKSFEKDGSIMINFKDLSN
jgi:hypothetical protein